MKHNIFLGSGSGSVGDVTSYRREGTQVSRLRVRQINNPKSYGQAEQRNFMAPVSKFYAPLAVALEQSWEGKTPSASYSAFAARNISLARAKGWYLPKGTGFYPMPYQVTQGTLRPVPLVPATDLSANGIQVEVAITSAMEGDTIGALSKALVSLGYSNGDQITVIFAHDAGNGSFYPTYYRFFLNVDSTDLLTTLPFTVAPLVAEATSISFKPIGDDAVAGTIIVSRYENEKWRRSTQTMLVSEDILTAITSETAKENAIASYRDGAFVPISEVYLNGATGNANAATMATIAISATTELGEGLTVDFSTSSGLSKSVTLSAEAQSVELPEGDFVVAKINADPESMAVTWTNETTSSMAAGMQYKFVAANCTITVLVGNF